VIVLAASLNGGAFIPVIPIYESANLPSEEETLILGGLREINIFRGVKLEKCSSQSQTLIGKRVVELLFSEEIIEVAINLIPREALKFHANLSECMGIRSIGAIAAFLLVFLGLMPMVGNVHVTEFLGVWR
tara:strand:+ start:1469 stop:1861 length:393 start_codon:yes stop_codon:yes gene_type:complete